MIIIQYGFSVPQDSTVYIHPWSMYTMPQYSACLTHLCNRPTVLMLRLLATDLFLATQSHSGMQPDSSHEQLQVNSVLTFSVVYLFV